MEFWKRNIEHLVNFLKYIWDRLLCVLIILGTIAIFSIIILATSQINNPTNIESQEILFLGISLNNWGTLITVLGLALTAIWSMYQYTKNKMSNQQEKSAEIAKLFSDELLDKCSLIGSVINASQLSSLLRLKNVDMNKLQRFDREEIIELYNNDSDFFNKYEAIIKGDNLQLTYLHILEHRISNKHFSDIAYNDPQTIEKDIISIMSSEYSNDEIEKLKAKKTLQEEFEKFYLKKHSRNELLDIYLKKYTDEEARNLFVLDNKDLPFDFLSLISQVLNELEYICMYISSQSAGTIYIYQSLHQIFLKTVKVLSVTIAYHNKNYTDKCYTNIIHVYKEWQKIREKNIKKEIKNKKKAFKYLDPKIKTV